MAVFVIPVAIGILKVVGLAMAAYEIYDTATTVGKNVVDSLKNVDDALDKAKDFMREEMEKIKKELGGNIDKHTEIGILYGLAETGDLRRQSEVTKHPGEHRGGATLDRTWKSDNSEKNEQIIAAIKTRIPFRKVIGDVCALADKMPVIQLRRKSKKLSVRDLRPNVSNAIKQVGGLAAEQLGLDEIAEDFIVVHLRQLVVSRIFEFADELLDWKSPLKAEACYGKGPGFADPKFESGTKLLRKGTEINPFWPTPQGKGSISADITIPDYRKDPLTKANTFALIEIKFKGDRPGKDQFKQYKELSEKCADMKTIEIKLPKTNGKNKVKTGCRVSLFRFPEDVAINQKENETNNNKQGETKPDNESAKKRTRKGGKSTKLPLPH